MLTEVAGPGGEVRGQRSASRHKDDPGGSGLCSCCGGECAPGWGLAVQALGRNGGAGR